MALTNLHIPDEHDTRGDTRHTSRHTHGTHKAHIWHTYGTRDTRAGTTRLSSATPTAHVQIMRTRKQDGAWKDRHGLAWVEHNLREIKSNFKKEHAHNYQYVKFFKKVNMQGKTEAKGDVKGGAKGGKKKK